MISAPRALDALKRPPATTVSVSAAGEEDEWEVAWYRERLHDPALLAGAIVVVVGWIRFLAVPVGGQRCGGFIGVTDPAHARLLRTALTDGPGFPAVRVRWSLRPSVCHVVEWGDAAPDSDDDGVRGRYHGYSEAAISRFRYGREAVREQRPQDNAAVRDVSIEMNFFGLRARVDGRTGLEAWGLLFQRHPATAWAWTGFYALFVALLVGLLADALL